MKYKCQFCGKIPGKRCILTYEFYCDKCNCSFCKNTNNLLAIWKDITENNKIISYNVSFSEGKSFVYSGLKRDNEVITPLELIVTFPFTLKLNPDNFEDKLRIILLFS